MKEKYNSQRNKTNTSDIYTDILKEKDQEISTLSSDVARYQVFINN